MLGGGAARADSTLSAIRLEATPDRLTLEGQVRAVLSAGSGCSLSANWLQVQLKLDPDRRALLLRGEQVQLCGDGGRRCLWANRLRMALGPTGATEVRHARLDLCRCPGKEHGPLEVFARKAWIAPGGRRVHLRRPSLRLGGVPLLLLPYWALPLGPGVSGLLTPSLGFSPRDGARLAQGVYWSPWDRGDLLLEGGWIQHRGASGRLRLRAAVGPLSLRAEGMGLRDGGWNRGWIRGALLLHGRGWSLGLRPYLVSDPLLLRALERRPLRALTGQLRSHAWIHGAAGAWHARAEGELVQAVGHGAAGGHLGLLSAATAGMSPVRLWGPLYLLLDGQAQHWEPLSTQAGAPRISLLSLSPALALGQRLGPLRLSAAARYNGGATRQQRRWQALHAALGRLELGLPLARDFGGGRRWLHRLEPWAGLSWSEVVGTASRATPAGTELVQGTTGRVGLRSGLWQRRGGAAHRVVRGGLWLEAPLELGLESLRAGAGLGWVLGRWLRGELETRFAPRSGSVTDLRGALCLASPPAGLQLCADYRRLRALGGEELVGAGLGWGQLAPWSPVGGDLWHGAPLVADQLGTSLTLTSTAVEASGRISWDMARGQLALSSFAVSVPLSCGCYRVGLQGGSLPGQRWPDVQLTLAMRGLAEGGCWR